MNFTVTHRAHEQHANKRSNVYDAAYYHEVHSIVHGAESAFCFIDVQYSNYSNDVTGHTFINEKME